MALGPFEHSAGSACIALLYPGKDTFDQVSVFDWLALRRFPSVPTPAFRPIGYAIDGILAIRHDSYAAVLGDCVKGLQDCRQLGPLIGLATL